MAYRIQLSDGPEGQLKRVVGQYPDIKSVLIAADRCGTPFIELIEDLRNSIDDPRNSIGFWPISPTKPGELRWKDLIRKAQELGVPLSPASQPDKDEDDDDRPDAPAPTVHAAPAHRPPPTPTPPPTKPPTRGRA